MKPQISTSDLLAPQMTPTIFDTIIALAMKYKTANLASGFPDWETPEFLLKHSFEAMNSGENQYSLTGGHPLLLQEIAKRYTRVFEREILPQNVCVGLGASGVIYDIYSTFLNPNDEVIVFEPFFEIHLKEARLLGANIVTTDFIEPKEFGTHPWTINFEELESLFNERTRMIVLNSPHNPTGKVFTREELERIAKILERFPKVLVLSDDVYETLVFDQREYVRFATIPGMFERTISTYSLGKMFSATGWRVGFCIGPDNLIKLVKAANAIISYSVHRPSQVGFAKSLAEADKPYLNTEDGYFKHMLKRFESNRNMLIEHFSKIDMPIKLTVAEGGFFIIGDIREAVPKIPKKYFFLDTENVEEGDIPINCTFEDLENPEVTPDVAFAKYLAIERGVSIIPLSSFFIQKKPGNLKEYAGRYLFRIAFCKKPETLQSAFDKLHI